MMKLPARPDGQWTVRQNSDKLPDLIATRNLTFDKEGYLRLSKPVISYYSDEDDADFGVPIGHSRIGAGIYWVLTDEKQFSLTQTTGTQNVAETTTTDAPVETSPTKPDATIFNSNIVYVASDGKTYIHNELALTGNWTVSDTSAGIGSGYHPVCNSALTNTLIVGDDNQVEQLNTSYAVTTPQLVLPAQYSVTGVAYSNGYIGITTVDGSSANMARFYVWDARSTAGNYAYDTGANACVTPTPYKGSFVFLTGDGQLMFWTPQSLEVLASFPSYYNGGTMFADPTSINKNHSIFTEGDLIYINIDGSISSPDYQKQSFVPEQSGGIWCYDPAVGLYHKHATTATKVQVDTIATSDVDVDTDSITVTTAYPTGTPCHYSSGGSTTLAGLTDDTLYYTIYVDATTIQLATSYENALAGTEIDLTGTGNNAQTLQFYPKSDFGQSYSAGQQGVVWTDARPYHAGGFKSGMFYGANVQKKAETSYKCGGFVLTESENRGYFVTSKFMSQGLQDTWQKLFIKHSELETGVDKIVVKYRTSGNEGNIVKITPTSSIFTWTDDDTFTTTDIQWANVLAGDEVEIVRGAGSGYLLHVSSITEDAGTYTVVLDESVKNIVATDTGRAIVSRWTLAKTLNSSTPQNEDGYSEISIGKNSKSIQFKIELRGEDVEIEELLIAHEPFKKVV